MTTKKRAPRTTHAYTIKEAAELLGIGTTQVSQWRAKHLLIEYPDGSLDVESTLTRANQMLNPTQGGKPDRGFGGRSTHQSSHRGELKSVGITRRRGEKRRRGDEFLPTDIRSDPTVALIADSPEVFAMKAEGASSLFVGFGPGGHVAGVNKGQFSAWEILAAALDVSGPADVVVCTWTTSGEAVSDLAQQQKIGKIQNLRMILDTSLRSREPEYCAALVSAFGPGAIRTTRNHAKWIVITNADWNIVIRGSMNFGTAPRLEYFEVSDDKKLADFLNAIADELWERAPVWNFESDGDGMQFSGEILASALAPQSDRLTVSEIATALNLSKTAVTRMRTSGVLTFDDDGCTTLDRAKSEYLEKSGRAPLVSLTDEISDEMPSFSTNDTSAIIAAKTLDAVETARWKALRNAKLEGILVPRDLAVEVFADGLTAVKSALTSLPVRWRHKFVGLQPAQVESEIRREVASILQEIGDALDSEKLGAGD